MDELFDFRGLRVTVMGLGRFGGGVAAVQFLAARGAAVTVTDIAKEDDLAESLARIESLPLLALHLGGHRDEDFRSADLVVANPAIRRDNSYLKLARHCGVAITSEMNLFWQFNRGRVAGVTGSNGKSTTTALLHSILKAAGWRCRLGGNIGQSLLPVVDEIQPDEWVVLELSSFQLHDLDGMFSSPQVAVVTNFSPNHLDWHGSLAEYRRAKQTILRWQTDEGIAVLNAADGDVTGWKTHGRRLAFNMSNEDCDQPGIFEAASEAAFRENGCEASFPLTEWLRLPGRHNRQNALAACCAALAMGVDVAAVKEGLASFTPLPHRLEFITEVHGRRFYNDSLATTPESTLFALESFCQPIVLLAGGYDKQVDLTALAEAIGTRAKAVALMGQTGPMLADLLETTGNPPPLRECHSFDEAFRWACEQSAPGEVVLLSPGCASYDWFRNFAERGERFAELVEAFRKGVANFSPASTPKPTAPPSPATPMRRLGGQGM